MSTDREFGPELFAFLRELRANNDRQWALRLPDTHAIRLQIAKDPDGWSDAKRGIELTDGASGSRRRRRPRRAFSTATRPPAPPSRL